VFSLCFRVFEVIASSDCAWGGRVKYLAFHVVVKLPTPAEAWTILPVLSSGPHDRRVDWLLGFVPVQRSETRQISMVGHIHESLHLSKKVHCTKLYSLLKVRVLSIIHVWMISSMLIQSSYLCNNYYRIIPQGSCRSSTLIDIG
jgi:hypothetical protein